MHEFAESNIRANHQQTGTLARICDFNTLEDGLLGIVARGEQKFVIGSTRARDNGLLMAAVETVEEPGYVDIPEQYSVLSLVAGRFMELLGSNYPSFQPESLQDASWVGYRLSELLPLENQEKQVLLEINHPLERLQSLLELMPRFQEPGENPGGP